MTDGGVHTSDAVHLAGPVGAGRAGVHGAIGIRSGEDIVLVHEVASAGDHRAFLVERGHLAEVVDGAVQLLHAACDLLALGVEPGTLADTILGIHRRGTVISVGRQIRRPLLAGHARCFREPITARIGAGESPEIGAAFFAGDEEAHR